MKREELKELGLTKEQIDKVCDLNSADINPLKTDLQKAQDDLKVANEKVTTNEKAVGELKGKLEEFKDVDVSELKKQIEALQGDLDKNEKEHSAALADRDFSDLVKESITGAKGMNTKAITALLDLDTLKTSKNQKEDISAALKALTEAEDSKMLFGEIEASPVGTGDLIGTVKKGGNNVDDAQMRAAMGLPPVAETTGK